MTTTGRGAEICFGQHRRPDRSGRSRPPDGTVSTPPRVSPVGQWSCPWRMPEGRSVTARGVVTDGGHAGRGRSWSSSAPARSHCGGPHTCCAVTGPSGDDLVQEALAKVYVAWPRIAATEAALSYTRTTMLRTYLNEKRKWRREVNLAELPEHPTDDQDTALTVTLSALLRELPDQAARRAGAALLPGPQRAADRRRARHPRGHRQEPAVPRAGHDAGPARRAGTQQSTRRSNDKEVTS